MEGKSTSTIEYKREQERVKEGYLKRVFKRIIRERSDMPCRRLLIFNSRFYGLLKGAMSVGAGCTRPAGQISAFVLCTDYTLTQCVAIDTS